MVFPVVMYGCESWTIKKAEHRRIDAFELWCWRWLLSPLDCKEIKLVNPKGYQSWIFIGSTDTGIPSWLRQGVSLQCWRPRFDPWVRKISWRRKWQSTPVLLPGKSHGRKNLVCYSPWSHKESDMTEWLHFHTLYFIIAAKFLLKKSAVCHVLSHFYFS